MNEPPSSAASANPHSWGMVAAALLLGIIVVLGLGWGMIAWRLAVQTQALQAQCARDQAAGNWSKLLLAAQAWRRLEPKRREPLQAGAVAAKELRQAQAVVDFLRDYPVETAEDVPWLEMRSDVEFGPLQHPEQGAETCREILRLTPHDINIRQKLVFYLAVTAQTDEMLREIRAAVEAESDLPEFVIYAFLADGLQLRDALDHLQKWMSARGRDETMMVAYALQKSRNLEGAVPPVNEEQAAILRNAQQQRIAYVEQLRGLFPRNHQVLAHDLGQAVQAGRGLATAELLAKAAPRADGDHRCWRARGWVFLRAANLSQARVAFDEALRLHPLDWRTRYYLADWARRSGDLIAAETQHRLAAVGKSLETELLSAPDVRSIAPDLMSRLHQFAVDSGDRQIADRLQKHMAGGRESIRPLDTAKP